MGELLNFAMSFEYNLFMLHMKSCRILCVIPLSRRNEGGSVGEQSGSGSWFVAMGNRICGGHS